MDLVQIIILAIIQGLAELLPVSSSAHVIIAQKLMGLDPSSPEMTFLIVMLHTGTMFAVILFFWKRWKKFLTDLSKSKTFITNLVMATGITGFLGLGLKILIEKVVLEGLLHHSKGEVENLFKVTPLIASALFLVGVFIYLAGRFKNNKSVTEVNQKNSIIIGLIQGLCLPFRGFSRSGATISAGMFLGIDRETCEEFSFALAVLLTPPVILLELKRLMSAQKLNPNFHFDLIAQLTPGLLGMVFSFFAGLIALKWLSSWLESGKWKYFGIYCMGMSILVTLLYIGKII